jgi:hypothetical protein
VKKVGYIRYGNIEETLNQLRQGIRSGGIVTLTGQGGVGKSRLLEQLVLEEPRIREVDQTALVRMVQPNRRLPGKDRIASPPAMVFFSRLWYVLQTMSRLTNKEWLETLDQKPARHYTDGDFLGLHANIAEAIRQRHIALILGDNVEYIDGLTFNWLMELWNDCQQQFAIVLCAEMKPNAPAEEPFTDLWPHASRDVREYLVNQVMLHQMDKKAFVEIVLPEILISLDADYGSDVTLSGLMWERTQGNWHSLTRLITFLDEELSSDTRSPRIITPKVVEHVFERR